MAVLFRSMALQRFPKGGVVLNSSLLGSVALLKRLEQEHADCGRRADRQARNRWSWQTMGRMMAVARSKLTSQLG